MCYISEAILIVRKNPKTESYNVYCNVARNSQKTILVANKGIEVPGDLEKQLSRETVGEFKVAIFIIFVILLQNVMIFFNMFRFNFSL